MVGDAPPGMISKELRELSNPEVYDTTLEPEEEEIKEDKDSIWHEGVVHRLAKETYMWNFSLIYREKQFDVIKWKTAFSWKEKKKEDDELLMNKALYIGADAGVFFIKIDENIYDNFTLLADMMDVFIEKTKGEAPLLIYGVLEDNEAVAKLKTNREMLTHLADIKKWAVQHRGEFKLENLKEAKMNLTYLVNDYSHFVLTHTKGKTNYPNLKLGEVHFLDHQDLTALKEIEEEFAHQAAVGQTADHLLSTLFFEHLEKPEYQTDVVETQKESTEAKEEISEEAPITPPPSKVKLILQDIQKGIRRACPKCGEFKNIHELTDRNHIVMENPRIYGLIYECGTCAHKWKRDWHTFSRIKGGREIIDNSEE